MSKEKIYIFDTTLRDGEQTQGVDFSIDDKFKIAKALDDLGVDYIIYIIPGLTMMSVINMAYQNSSSSIMQAKYLKFIEDYLIAPISGFELSLSFIIGGMMRGIMNGFAIILTCWILTDITINNYFLTFFFIGIVSFTFGAVGVIIGIISKTWDQVGVFSNFVFMPLSMLGGVFWSRVA